MAKRREVRGGGAGARAGRGPGEWWAWAAGWWWAGEPAGGGRGTQGAQGGDERYSRRRPGARWLGPGRSLARWAPGPAAGWRWKVGAAAAWACRTDTPPARGASAPGAPCASQPHPPLHPPHLRLAPAGVRLDGAAALQEIPAAVGERKKESLRPREIPAAVGAVAISSPSPECSQRAGVGWQGGGWGRGLGATRTQHCLCSVSGGLEQDTDQHRPARGCGVCDHAVPWSISPSPPGKKDMLSIAGG